MFRLTSLWILALLHVLSSTISTNYSEVSDGGGESVKVLHVHHHGKGIEDLLGNLDGETSDVPVPVISSFTEPATLAEPDAEIDEDEWEETHLEDVEPTDKRSELGEEIEVEEIEAPYGEGFEAGDEKSDLNVDSSSEDLSTTQKVCSIVIKLVFMKYEESL